jgi:hypothetical protein
MVVGAGLVLGSLLILGAGPGEAAPPFFEIALRAQFVIGVLVLIIGLALWRHRIWARSACLFLLRVGACLVVGWSIYFAFDVSTMGPIGVLPAVMLFAITGFWLTTFKRGISYLNQPTVISELEGGVQ